MSAPDFREVGDTSKLERWPVAAFYLEDQRKRVSVARVGDDLYAFDDVCPEHACSLQGGLLKVKEKQIMCQIGGCHFDITTGKVVKGPATTDLAVYPAREVDGKLQVQV